MKITVRKLKLMSACEDAVEWVRSQNETDVKKLIKAAMTAGRFLDCNWFMTRIMSPEEGVRYASYAVSQVLHIYEKKYPKDMRPRNVIMAAKKYLKSRISDSAMAAGAAGEAASEVIGAIGGTAERVAWAAREVAWAVEEVACGGDAWVTWVTRAIGDAWEAEGDAAWAAARKAAWIEAGVAEETVRHTADSLKKRCINYGLKILKNKLMEENNEHI